MNTHNDNEPTSGYNGGNGWNTRHIQVQEQELEQDCRSNYINQYDDASTIEYDQDQADEDKY